HFDKRAVLAAAQGFVMLDLFAAGDAGEDFWFLRIKVGWDQDRDRLAQRLADRVAIKALGAAIPAHDHPAEILAEDRITRGIDDAGKLAAHLLGTALLADVEQRSDPAVLFARLVEQGRVEAAQQPRLEAGESDFELVLRRLAAQDLLDVGTNRREAVFPEDVGDVLADHLI